MWFDRLSTKLDVGAMAEGTVAGDRIEMVSSV